MVRKPLVTVKLLTTDTRYSLVNIHIPTVIQGYRVDKVGYMSKHCALKAKH
jgi:hypothetical protein